MAPICRCVRALGIPGEARPVASCGVSLCAHFLATRLLQLHYSPGTGLVYGTRSAFLPPGQDFNGALVAGATLKLPEKLPALYTALAAEHAGLVAIAVYGEVYGGWYPHADVPAAKPSRRPVQRGVWYSPQVRIVAFDVRLETSDATAAGGTSNKTAFLPFDAASAACTAVGIPFIAVAKAGPLDEVCEWAVAHSRDNALAHYNPEGLPLLEDNAGEGFVVRLAIEAASEDGSARALAKVKNPSFAEVAEGSPAPTVGGAGDKPVDPAEAAGAAVAAKYLNEHRAAAVISKLPDAEVTPKNLKALAEALAADARADPVIEADELAAVAGTGKGARVFTARAFAVMKAFLAARAAAP